jgi:hypothetical protein
MVMDGDAGGCALAVVIGALLLMLVASIGHGIGVARERGAAVAAGVARWAVDPRSGETTFVYGYPKGSRP